ncbi:LacI family DNA-binding transcriptional regulator [Tranquillimonas rosea]|uniref:LacI family DNA-binding transcriptional regulator n=1 Tax=Tranquillimonas rosea TaxID=641238 RepID=UPI003BAD1583
MDKRAISIRDVAQAAGVSTATVSRALNAPGRVSEETRRAVLEAVKATGYSVNPAGRNLRQRRTGSVVALVPNIANPFFSAILAGISSVLRPAGLNLLIADTLAGENREGPVRDYLDRTRSDGVILFDGNVSPTALEPRAGVETPPLVMACEWLEGCPLPHVGIDNAAGARVVTEHLLSLGHRDVAHVMGPPENVLTQTRAEGYRTALAEAGLPCRDDWILPGDFSLASGARAAEMWLALPDRPRAVFCSNDEMACGFISALAAKGVSVPRDVSVAGFDDIELAQHVHPPLTTLHQPRRALGIDAAKLLLDLIAAPELYGATHRIEPVELVRRGSTAAPCDG